MFKKFRIQYEGLHRVGIIVGIFSILFIPWLILGVDNNYRDNMFEFYFGMWEEMIENAYKEGVLVFIFIIAYHIISYLLGYFIFKFLIWLTTWLREGFKK